MIHEPLNETHVTDPPFKFSPYNGQRVGFTSGPLFQLPEGVTREQYIRDFSAFPWNFNPWTGYARSGKDVRDDPQGARLVPPGQVPLHPNPPPAPPHEHQLYKDGDPNIPEVLCDRDGRVALAQCKVCGQAEGDLEDSCPVPMTDVEMWILANASTMIPFRGASTQAIPVYAVRQLLQGKVLVDADVLVDAIDELARRANYLNEMSLSNDSETVTAIQAELEKALALTVNLKGLDGYDVLNLAPLQGERGIKFKGLRAAVKRAKEKSGYMTATGNLCEDCPPIGYPTDKTRCDECPRQLHAGVGSDV